MQIVDEKYVSFTTFTQSGKAKPTPVWIVDLGDGKVGFTTFSTSWKVKRLANDPKVTLQPSDSRGNATEGTDVIEATAVAVQGAEFERVRTLVKKKYGIQFTMISFFGSIRRILGKDSGTDTAIIVTLPE